ncbi:MAG: UvrD-helicase domain-containing protein [Desulfatiglans sp.]|jgi:DNA helicase-2/ATP-dependent DNA helicase PcrA|nr:UvrD-helicase domain-containing protein [Desulfatiglans sp.]
MKFIADLHIHSRFSRATSKTLDPENLFLWAQKKGIAVVGTGDFTHPGWFAELTEKLVEAETGLFKLRPDLEKEVTAQVPDSCRKPVRFLLSGEISCIYKKNSKSRKIHHLFLMPDMASVSAFNKQLDRIGNIKSDGRPILGLDSRDLLEIALEASDQAFLIPAHVWTPWFSLFGSKSGFDTLEECFEDLSGHIHALETGLSSDPPMNRLLSELDKYLLVSNSDAHSPGKLGREANLFNTDMDYSSMVRAMTDGQGFDGTIEFFPEEGKYHLDGHRKCNVRLSPEETKGMDGVCPVCGGPLTVGVSHRIHELSDRQRPRLTKDFMSLIPLPEVLSELLKVGPSTQKVSRFYEKLLAELGPELQILTEISLESIHTAGGPILAEAIKRMRRGEVIATGGYDGEYGVIRLFDKSEMEAHSGQIALFMEARQGAPKNRKTAAPRTKTPAKKQPPSPDPASPLKDPILDPLNREQKRAVVHQKGHLIVVAGPGTGKTMTLTHRIAYLVRSGVAKPEHILALTFTRKTAGEMTDRVDRLLAGLGTGPVRVATFHRFCLDVLRDHGKKIGLPIDFTLCSEIDSECLIRDLSAETDKGKGPPGRFLQRLPIIKRRDILGQADHGPDEPFLPFVELYDQRLKELGMIDLDDLEVSTLRLFREHPDVPKAYGKRFPYLFVDEYQDTNRVQAELLRILVQLGEAMLFVIGDPDQAIYGFRGGDVENFRRFFHDFPEAGQVKLIRSYRSTETILRASGFFMGHSKPLEGEGREGEPVAIASCATESEEAEMIVEQVEKLLGGISYFSIDSGRANTHREDESPLGFGDIAVLYRLNAQGDALGKAFQRSGIPFVRSGEKPPIHRYPVNLIWRFFQALEYPLNPYYKDQYEAILSDHGIRGDTDRSSKPEGSMSDLLEAAIHLHGLNGLGEEADDALVGLRRIAEEFRGDLGSFLDRLSLQRGIDHETLVGDRVALMSLHAAKGLEWPVVFIIGCEDQLIPCSLFGEKDLEEEKRLLYVGMTRACARLILSHTKKRSLNGRILRMNPSPFLNSMPEDVLRPLERGQWKPRARAHKQLDLFSDPL